MTNQHTVDTITQGIALYSTCLQGILFWDYVNTLPSEIRVVWIPLFSQAQKNQWRIANLETRFYMVLSLVLFIGVRYLALIEFGFAFRLYHTNVGEAFCRHIQHFLPMGSAVVAICASGILALRVIVLWNRDFWIKVPLGILYIGISVVVLWGSYYTLPQPGQPNCNPLRTNNNINAFYLGVAIFDAIVTALTIWRVIMVRKRQKGAPQGHIFRVMVRDGVIYFVFIFSSNLLATIFELQTIQPLFSNMHASLATVMTSIFASRIYINVRSEARKQRLGVTGGLNNNIGKMPSQDANGRRRSSAGGNPTANMDGLTGGVTNVYAIKSASSGSPTSGAWQEKQYSPKADFIINSGHKSSDTNGKTVYQSEQTPPFSSHTSLKEELQTGPSPERQFSQGHSESSHSSIASSGTMLRR